MERSQTAPQRSGQSIVDAQASIAGAADDPGQNTTDTQRSSAGVIRAGGGGMSDHRAPRETQWMLAVVAGSAFIVLAAVTGAIVLLWTALLP